MASLKIRIDENAADKFSKGKKFVNVAEKTKRLALGDLQNRAELRANLAATKENAQKDLKDVKLQNALRITRSRVDSYWKKAPLSDVAANVAASVQPAATNLPKPRKALTRTNSVRQTGPNVPLNNVNGVAVHRTVTNNVIGQTKPKTVITKVIENKVQTVKYVNKAKPEKPADVVEKIAAVTTLRREDSNLSRKSLTKLKAALNRDVATKQVTKTSAVVSVPPVVKKDKQSPRAVTTTVKVAPKLGVAKAELKSSNVQTHSTKLLSAVEDIDAGDADNLVLVSEYVADIYDYLYTVEVEHAIRPNHLEGQEEVFPKMRAVLIDWLNEVHLQFHLAPETFQMAVAIIDRYLQNVKNTKRSHLQLVGVTALFIAAKYEELFPPSIVDFVYITDDTYVAAQILQMELKIFKSLDYNLARPLPIQFLRRYSKAANAEDYHHTMSKYFLELAAIEYDLAAYKPSEIAAASLFLALHILKDNPKKATGFNNAHWTATLEWYSRYSADHLRPITKKLATIARNASTAKLKSVYTKYQSSKFDKISLRSELYGPLMDSIVNSKE